jgi:hypothetical protein
MSMAGAWLQGPGKGLVPAIHDFTLWVKQTWMPAA